MPLVTVIGAMNQTFAVTVEGTHAHDTLKQYSAATSRLYDTVSSSVGGGAVLPMADSLMAATMPCTVSSSTLSVQNTTPVIPSSFQMMPVKIGGMSETISAAGNQNLSSKNGNIVSVDGPLNFIGGVTDVNNNAVKFVKAGKVSLHGRASRRYFLIGTNKQSHSFFERRHGHVFLDASQSHGALDTWVGDKDTVKGGTVDEHFHLDKASRADNVITQKDSSDSSKLPEILGNDQCSHYVIEDFNRAIGNKVVLNCVSQKELTNMIEHKTVLGGSTIISIPDKTDIIFVNNDNIKKSDFILS